MIGNRLGPYEITAKLGEGGMGEVWKAKDFHLGRDVALKVLPEGFTQDAERLARFEREAKLLAQLNHPNIAQIYGLEVSGDTRALVMELVEGPTLAERLAQGPFPFNESLSVSLQIADALEEAHEKGIVHRDLKPQNIKASIEGKVKVLDFGLAKAMDPVSPSGMSPHELAHSPTMTLGGTREGVILGTAAYMAPEQARGSAVDKRADIWAFGVVLYEMLSGERLFAEGSVVDTLSAVMRKEIDLGRLPATTPSRLRELVRRCLERNPKNRLRDIGEARVALVEIAAAPADAERSPATSTHSQAARRPRWGLALAALTAAVALGWFASRAFEPAEVEATGPSHRFRQLTREPGGEREPSLAPDGESFAYAKRSGGQSDILLRRVDGTKSTNLTPDCALDDNTPAFSPDGRKIAYRSECGGGGIFVMGATGESARRVTDSGYSPAWSPDGRELALADVWTDNPSNLPGISTMWAVDVESGKRRVLSRHDARSPAWSPHGKRVAFWGLRKESFQRDVWTVAADGSQAEAAAAVPVVDDLDLDFGATWSPDGRFLLFGSGRGGSLNLWRIAIDEASGRIRGSPEPVAVPSGFAGWPTISRDGRRFLFVDRNARTTILRAPVDPARRALAGPPTPVVEGSFEIREQSLSPDGQSILFSNADLPASLHLTRADGTGYRQLTEGGLRDRQAHWSPDSSTIAFQTMRFPSGLAMIGVDGSGLRAIETGSKEGVWEPTWSPDGKWLAINDNLRSFLFDARGSEFGRKEIPRPCPDCLFLASDWAERGGFLLGSVIEAGTFLRYATYELDSQAFGLEHSADVDKLAGALAEQYPKLFPDERAFVGNEGNRLVVHELDGRPPRELLRLGEGARAQRLSLSKDGRWLTFIESNDESDIWLATSDDVAEGP